MSLYLFFLTDTDVIMTLCLLHYSFLSIMFSYEEKLLTQHWKNAQLMHPLTSGIHDFFGILPKADILNI